MICNVHMFCCPKVENKLGSIKVISLFMYVQSYVHPPLLYVQKYAQRVCKCMRIDKKL